MGLKQKTLTGFIWSSAGTLGNGLISFIVTMILARLLLPYHFALVALLQIFLAISNVIVDSGFSQAIIRDDNPSKTDLSSVFYFNVILSLFIYIILFLSAPYIGSYFKAPELTLLSRIVFLVIIFNSFSIIQNAILNRNLNFAVLNKSSVLGSIIAGFISIIMAVTGFGIWALVANMVLLPFSRSIILWYNSKWRPTKIFSFLSVKKYFAFGGFLMFQGIIDAISTNLVSLLIGKVYTKNDLGYYSQGKKFEEYLVIPFNSIVSKVTYPILSKIKNEDSRLKNGYRQIVGVIMFLFLPTMFFTIATAENMIVSFLGTKWAEAGVYLKIASVGGLFFPLQHVCTNVIMIKGKTKVMLQFAFIKQGIRILLLLGFMNKGVLVLALLFTASTIIGSLLYIIIGMSYLKYSFFELFQDLYKTFFSSLIGIVFVISIGHLITNINTTAIFCIQVIIMGVIYILCSKVFRNEYFKEVLLLIKPIILRLRK